MKEAVALVFISNALLGVSALALIVHLLRRVDALEAKLNQGDDDDVGGNR